MLNFCSGVLYLMLTRRKFIFSNASNINMLHGALYTAFGSLFFAFQNRQTEQAYWKWYKYNTIQNQFMSSKNIWWGRWGQKASRLAWETPSPSKLAVPTALFLIFLHIFETLKKKKHAQFTHFPYRTGKQTQKIYMWYNDTRGVFCTVAMLTFLLFP